MLALGAIDARDYAEMLVDERPIVLHGRAVGTG
jgi:hypothetical protein